MTTPRSPRGKRSRWRDLTCRMNLYSYAAVQAHRDCVTYPIDEDGRRRPSGIRLRVE